ncbi:DUF6090 family protein [Mangrovimonas sp. AS39]|uniref:DUF6090 family protein n=1 Tax=Mangrovimonas futianensis TaxID=2895523 RepID=UPI001E2B39E8|nr:DUF6090 family protein [Mangrovimonas futianensis]MCF1190668.1 DUF6090 family protein [Mangrovimonas futianensis]MCF1194365.1 DUF6090 family protein [Mangrovimonas futianensis]
MISFFRRIRRTQVSESRFGKYLLYAIGEIILVVIGILIALQINEWNNERHRKETEATLIKQLKNDLETSAMELEDITAFYLKRAQASAAVERAFWKKGTPPDSIIDLLGSPARSRIYSPVLGTARSLINSGKIDILSSDSLKNGLISYLEKVDYLLKDISRYEETYYREAVKSFHNILTSVLWTESLPEIQKRIEENRDTIMQRKMFQLKLNNYPLDLDTIPFNSNLEDLFKNRDFYIAYKNFSTAHRNIYYKYDVILELTQDLLGQLE